jgi:hypothetical protein
MRRAYRSTTISRRLTPASEETQTLVQMAAPVGSPAFTGAALCHQLSMARSRACHADALVVSKSDGMSILTRRPAICEPVDKTSPTQMEVSRASRLSVTINCTTRSAPIVAPVALGGSATVWRADVPPFKHTNDADQAIDNSGRRLGIGNDSHAQAVSRYRLAFGSRWRSPSRLGAASPGISRRRINRAPACELALRSE